MSETHAFIDHVKAGHLAEVVQLLEIDPQLANAHDTANNSAVILAMYYGKPEVATVLVERGATLNLFEAAATGHLKEVRDLIQTDPTLKDAFSQDGFTALHLAAFFGRPDVMELLIERGASINPVSKNGQKVMPLHSAVAHYQQDVATKMTQLLLNKGAEVNAKQADGFTPLMGAAQNGNINIIRLLLDRGADINLPNDQGKTAWDIAVESDQPAAAEFLKVNGAKVK